MRTRSDAGTRDHLGNRCVPGLCGHKRPSSLQDCPQSHHPVPRASLPSTLPRSERSPSRIKISARLTAVFLAPGGTGGSVVLNPPEVITPFSPWEAGGSIFSAGSRCWWECLSLRSGAVCVWGDTASGLLCLRRCLHSVRCQPESRLLRFWGAWRCPSDGHRPRWRLHGGWSWDRCLGWGVTLVL